MCRKELTATVKLKAMTTLQSRIQDFTKNTGLNELVKSDALLLKELYRKMDEADSADDMDEWSVLCEKSDLIHAQIKNKIKEQSPIELEDVVLRNLTAQAIDANW